MEAASSGERPEAGLTAGQAARRLGVAVTTLRSWHQRYGLGPTRHTHGRHRRYGAEDLARLETMRTLTAQGMPAAEAAALAASGLVAQVRAAPADQPAADQPGASARAVRGLLEAAGRLDHERVRELVARMLAQVGVVRAWEELVCPALVRIGERHAATGAMVEVEHLLSRTVSEALTTVPRATPEPGAAGQVLLACADEEQHTLPLEALAAAAAERGVPCRQLGARVPPAALSAAVRRTGPALLVLWSHAPATGDPEQLRALRQAVTRAPMLAAAGPGWPVQLPEGVARPATLEEAVQLAVAAGRAGRHPA